MTQKKKTIYKFFFSYMDVVNPAFEIFKFVTFFVTNLNSHPNLVEITFVTFDVTNLKFRSLPFHLELEILMTRVIGIGNKRN